MQLAVLEEPAHLSGAEVNVATWPLALGLQPAKIGVGRY
jgi:hypothetical protein